MESIYDLIIVGGGPAVLRLLFMQAGRSGKRFFWKREAMADVSTIPMKSGIIPARLWTAAST